MFFVLLLQVDKGTAGLNGTDGETTTQGENGLFLLVPPGAFQDTNVQTFFVGKSLNFLISWLHNAEVALPP